MEKGSDLKNRIRELIEELNAAAKAYYAEDREIMDNYSYDRLYDELVSLEKETGIYFSDSPTQNVGYEAVKSLPEIRHEQPMLSLEKTKDIEELRKFIGENKTLLSWKMDGLTIVLTYRQAELFSAVTRGNGVSGELVTNNARVFKGLPLKIPFKGELIIRGEAYITYADFEAINEKMPETEARYKNPRNLCSGSVRQLDSSVAAARNIRIKIFALVKAERVDFSGSHENEFIWLKDLGFDVVEYKVVTADTFDDAINYFSEKIKTNEFPSDGLVALYDDIAYGESLGRTAKAPKNAMAFKWADELKQTRLLEVEWSPSRTGLINPIAIFEPVELEGTTVSRASLHNVSILKSLKLGKGDEISVYKANMIIPQIAENLTKSDTLEIPKTCPACGKKTRIEGSYDVQTLVCDNPDCPAKAIKSFVHFVGRNAMDIDGISESTLEKFMAHGIVRSYADLFKLDRFKDTIVKMDGFGEKSYDKLIAAANKARETSADRLLYAMGIPNVGSAAARLIAEYFDYDIDKMANASKEELCRIEGVGETMAAVYVGWWSEPKKANAFRELLPLLKLKSPSEKELKEAIKGKTFVITGKLNNFSNRDELKEFIQNAGGKVTGSVSEKTDYLINNDIHSVSAKNKRARELNIPIISEEEFKELAK